MHSFLPFSIGYWRFSLKIMFLCTNLLKTYSKTTHYNISSGGDYIASKRVAENLTIDSTNERIVWEPDELQGDIDKILGILESSFGYKIEGDVYSLEDGRKAVDYVKD